MVFLRITLLEEEHEVKVALVEEIQEEKEVSYVHIVVSLTTLLMNATQSMAILLNTGFTSLKV